MRTLVLSLALLVGVAACETGPEAEGPAPAEPGPFEAEVQGAMEASMAGETTARLDTTGRLVGLELDAAEDTLQAGLSFELAAKPPTAVRTYQVTPRDGGREDTSFSLMNAYLRLRGHEFAARAGSLRVDRDSSGLHGAFDLRLRGFVDAASDEASTVTVRGRFDDLRIGGDR